MPWYLGYFLFIISNLDISIPCAEFVANRRVDYPENAVSLHGNQVDELPDFSAYAKAYAN